MRIAVDLRRPRQPARLRGGARGDHGLRMPELWCLGDLVGYGADPDACVDLAREHAAVSPGRQP